MRRLTRLTLLSLLLLLVSSVTFAQQEDNDDYYPVIVVLNTAVQPENQLSSVSSVQSQRLEISNIQKNVLDSIQNNPAIEARNVTTFLTLPYLAMSVNDAGRRALEADPNVQAVFEDVPMPPATDSAITHIDGDVIHLNGYTGSGQIVAILDTGVDATHPALNSGKVVWQACFNSAGSWPNTVSICPNGTNTQLGGNAASPYPGTCTGCDHGTHVAGIAAGRDTNASGYDGGVAPDAQIIAINVFTLFTSGSDCGSLPAPCALSFVSDQLEALEYLYTLSTPGNSPYYNNIASANMSLGGGQYSGTCDADEPYYVTPVQNLRNRGIAVVAASGNEGFLSAMGAPACVSNVVSVGASDDSDGVGSFSNVSAAMDVFAPGVNITSSVPGGGYETWNGTSMATPMVAGTWALMKQAFPTYSVTQILSRLTSTGVPIADINHTKPRIDLDAAIVPPTTTVQFSSPSTSATENDVQFTVTVSMNVGTTPAVLIGPNIPLELSYGGTATRNSDYTAPDSVTFTQSSWNSGIYNTTFNVTVLTDAVIDAGENFTITLIDSERTNVNLGGTAIHTVTITDTNVPATGQVNMAFDGSTVGESEGVINVPVTLDVVDGPPNLTGPVTVNLTYGGSAVASVDYTAPSTVTFSESSYAAGQYEALIPVTVIEQVGEQGTRTLTITLASEAHPSVSIGGDTTFTLQIVDMSHIDINEQMLHNAIQSELATANNDIEFALVDFQTGSIAFTVRLKNGTVVTLTGVVTQAEGLFSLQYQNILVNGTTASADVLAIINTQLPPIVASALDDLMLELGGPFGGVFNSTLDPQNWEMLVFP